MTCILAVYTDPDQNWHVLGHTRETGEENYLAAASFYPAPFYRVVGRMKHGARL